MQELSLIQLIHQNRLGPEFEQLRRIYSDVLGTGLRGWIAGGAIRRTLIFQKNDSDIDFFFVDEAAKDEAIKNLREKYEVVGEKTNEFNTSFDVLVNGTLHEKTVKFQFIYFTYYENVQSLLDSFDFTICQFAIDNISLYHGDLSMFDLGQRRIVINKLTYPVASMRRLIKYTQQGFYACQGTLTDFLNKVVEKPELVTGDIKYID